MNNVILGFILTCIAGLSTMVGALFIFYKKINENILTGCLSFAAGVMLTVSLSDLIPNSYHLIETILPKSLIISIFFVIGIIISMTIDKLFPNNIATDNINNYKLYRLGIFSMIAIILHNIPEGIATFIATNSNISLGISLTIAIALHNIPEGISIAMPIYYATKNKKDAFKYTLISSLSEPLGAILAFIFLSKLVTNNILGIIFTIIAGIMCHLSVYELLPMAKKYHKPIISITFFLIGSILMIINHLIFG